MTNSALIVDDSRLACKVLSNMLDSYGISNKSLHTAESAIEYLKQHKPNVIFLDHSMPGMDGFEAVQLIKNTPETAMIPVLMYTSKEGDMFFGRARALGAVDVLPKGLEKGQLEKALMKLGLIATEQPETQDPDTAAPNTQDPSTQGKVSHIETVKASNDLESSVDKVQFTVEPTPINATASSDDDQHQAESDFDWQHIWFGQLQPFLNQKNAQQIKEIRLSNAKQTSYLTREVHQTLEHFEHVVVCRMEMLNELSNAQSHARSIKSRYAWGFVLSTLVLIQAAMIWQIHALNKAHHAGMAYFSAQPVLPKAQDDQREGNLEHLTDQLASSDEFDVEAQFLTEEAQNIAAVPGTTLQITDSAGEWIADIYRAFPEDGYFKGQTATGYQFTVDHQGNIGWPLSELYYLTNDCQGDVYIESLPGLLYRDAADDLWYVDKSAVKVEMSVYSKLDVSQKNSQCVVLEAAEQVLSLIEIRRNNSLETDIDMNQTQVVNKTLTY